MFAKVFAQIFDSSIAEEWQVRIVFEDMLKLCDCNGVVDMTHESISRRTNVPIEIVRAGITKLEAEDPKSRNPEYKGQRIIRLDDHRDWGWFIVNYAHYRNLASEEQKREKTLARVHKHRGKSINNAPVTHCNAPVTPVNACNAMQKEREKEKENKNKQIAGSAVPKPANKRKIELNDPEFINEMKKLSPGIDVDAEILKAQKWCLANRKQLSRRRLVNWLNRVEKPMNLSRPKVGAI